MSQVLKVLNKLREKGSTGITQKTDADRWRPAVGRLAARIGDLRGAGHDIRTIMEDNTHNSGRHARYVLIKEAGNE